MKVFGLFIFLICTQSYSTELYEVHRSIRALGMGNAYTAVARDGDSLFYNPAGLGRTSAISWRILSLSLGVNGLNAYNTIQDVQEATTLEDQLQAAMGQPLWFGGEAVTAVTGPGFGFGVYDSFNLSADLSNPALPTFNLGYFNDFGYSAGLGMEFVKGFSIGLVGSRISRTGSNVPIGVETLASLDTDDFLAQIQNQGTGYALDVGATIEFPTPLKPTLAAVLRNVGKTSFASSPGTTAPPMAEDELAFGYSMLIDLPGLDIIPAMDFRYLNRADIQLAKKLHFGVEFGFPLIAARAGFHQGYYTLGFGANVGLMQIELATYGVELGEYPGQHEDRRYLFELKFELGLDVGSSSGKTGRGTGSRGLKQRR